MKSPQPVGLGRPLDPAYPSNRIALALSGLGLLVGAGAALGRGEDLVQVALYGLFGSFAVFLAWALAREIDPDNNLSAHLAGGLMLIAVVGVDTTPHIFGLFLVLQSLRALNRTAGFPCKPADMVMLALLAAFTSYGGLWVLGVWSAVVLLLDSLPTFEDASPMSRMYIFPVIFATAIGGLLGEAGDIAAVEASWLGIAGVIGLAFLGLALTAPAPVSQCDTGDKLLSKGRINATQVLAVIAGVLVLLWEGGERGFLLMLPLWLVFLTAGAVRLLQLGNIAPAPRNTLMK